MKSSSSVAILSALAARSVSAGWFDQSVKSIVENTPQQCTSQESKGFDWNDLAVGPIKEPYDNYNFQGYTCRTSPLKNDIQKRNINKRFLNNCITSDITLETFTNEISCSKQFSITHLYVSVDEEVDVEFQYSMKDGSTCRQIQTCSGTGTKIENTQCGGAVSVKTRIFNQSSKKVAKCGFNIHKIEFNCGSNSVNSKRDYDNNGGQYAAPSMNSKPPCTKSLTVAPPINSKPPCTKSLIAIPSVSSKPPCSEPIPTTTPSCTAKGGIVPTPSGNPTPYDDEDYDEEPYGGNPMSTPSKAILPLPSTTSPVNPIYTPNSISSIAIASTTCTKGNAPIPPSSIPVVPTPGCPNLLPQCMQTFLKLTSCVNTGDVNCLCSNTNFVKQVMSCITSWGVSTTDEIPKAFEYFQGLCAAQIPQNPCIITDVPKYISFPPATGPLTTVHVSSTMVIPNSCTESQARSTIHIQSFVTKTILTAVTLPAVKIIPSGTSNACLVPATVSVPALSYPASPAGPTTYDNSPLPVPSKPPTYGYNTPLSPNPTGARFNSTNNRYNSTGNVVPPSYGAANSLNPVKCSIVFIASLVSFVFMI